MSLLREVRCVARKELLDGVRDRRSVMSALLMPLLGPILIAVMFTVLVEEEAKTEPVPLPVIGAGHAAALVEHLAAHDVEIIDPPPDPRAAVAAGDEKLVLEIPPDFEVDFRAGRPAMVSLYVDSSRRDSRKPARRVRRAIEGYAAKIGSLRLLARGVDPKLARPVAIEDVDTATPKQKAAMALATLPMFVTLALFVCGMFLATDSTAGERERGSLEPLFLTPATRLALVLGKWAATTAFAGAGVVMTLVGSLLAMSQVPLEGVGLQMNIGVAEAARMLGALLPLAPGVAAAQMLVASFAKSFREAQTYLSIVSLLPMSPTMLLSFKPMAAEGWAVWVPVLGQQVVLLAALRGDPVAWSSWVATAVTSLAVATGCIYATVRLFERERTLF